MQRYDDREEIVAERAARNAVKKTFAILGVNIDKPEDVEEFRRDLRFAGDLRRLTSKSLFAFVLSLISLTVAAIWVTMRGD